MVHGGQMNVLVADNAGAKSMGSRLAILDKDIQNLEVQNLVEEQIFEENISQKIMQNWQRENLHTRT